MRQRSRSATRTLIGPEELRVQLEAVRLELRALYRSLDRMLLAQDLPPELGLLQELDADFAEALWVLDQPPAAFDRAAMTKDTVDSLERMPEARERFFASFDGPTRELLEERVRVTHRRLPPEDAYLEVPGRDRSA